MVAKQVREECNEFPNRVTHKRIMLFIHSMQGGGSERQLSYLANELVHQAEICLVTLDSLGKDNYLLDPRIERIGLGLTSNSSGFSSALVANIRRIWILRNAIAKWKPAIVVSFCDSNNILALAASPASVPVIISERSDPRHQKLSWFWEKMRRYTYGKCRACVVQTSEIGDYLNSNGLVQKTKLVTIPSAIESPSMDLVAFENMRAKRQPKTLVYVGRLSKEKRVDRLLLAWSRLQHHHLDWRINLVGDGDERKALEDLSSQLGISSSVQFSGWSNDVWEPLRLANAFCLVSQYEGFPQSMLEAMASGLPVAVMDCSPSIRQTIVDGTNGLIISGEDQIAVVLDKLLRDESLRQLLGKKAAESAREYEWSNIAPHWLKVIE